MSEVEGACRIEDVLAREGAYVATTAGVSMRPMLRDRRDTVVIEPCAGRLAKYDVPLYRRGSDYVLHRVVDVLPDSYVICGDNCVELERGVTDEQVVGVLAGFYRGERRVRMDAPAYRLYARLWCALYPARAMVVRARRAAARWARRLS